MAYHMAEFCLDNNCHILQCERTLNGNFFGDMPQKRRKSISDGIFLPFVLETFYLYGNIKFFLPLEYKLAIRDGKIKHTINTLPNLKSLKMKPENEEANEEAG